MTRTLIAGLLALCGLTHLWAQPSSDAYQRIDGIVAVVGDEIVLSSDVRDRVTQAQLEGREVSADNECGLIESILFEKLLLHNARLDSLEVTDAEGRTVLEGAFLEDVSLDLHVPTHLDERLQVRVADRDEVAQTIEVDPSGRASAIVD